MSSTQCKKSLHIQEHELPDRIFFSGKTVCYCSWCRKDIWKIYPCILSICKRYIYILWLKNSKWIRLVDSKLIYITITQIRTLFMGIAYQSNYISKCIHIYYDIAKAISEVWRDYHWWRIRRTNPDNFRYRILCFFMFKFIILGF